MNHKRLLYAVLLVCGIWFAVLGVFLLGITDTVAVKVRPGFGLGIIGYNFGVTGNLARAIYVVNSYETVHPYAGIASLILTVGILGLIVGCLTLRRNLLTRI